MSLNRSALGFRARLFFRTGFAPALFSTLACIGWTVLHSHPSRTPTTQTQILPNPILFVTQTPLPDDFTNVVSTFGNHLGAVTAAPRGGDLYILYPDETLRNLTQEAGWGSQGFQGEDSIAVREPCVHWSGQKALFSMVVGGPSRRYVAEEAFWQIYEVKGLGPDQPVEIRRVLQQPKAANNVSPIYLSDDRILFTSDRPRDGSPHLYPQLDEYESAPSNSGLWRLDPISGRLDIIDHSPSGDFSPLIDSFGRIIWTRWDHLQRDQQADADADADAQQGIFGTFDYSDESEDAAKTSQRQEFFPEPRAPHRDSRGVRIEGLRFNHFFPWMAQQDGSGLETLNHVGRHELHAYFNRSFSDDPSLAEFIGEVALRDNPRSLLNFLQIAEDPLRPGLYLGVDAPEFSTHSAGQIVALQAPPGLSADRITVEALTHPATVDFTPDSVPAPAGHSGLYRDPLPLSDGGLIAVHTAETRRDINEGTRGQPLSRYDFRLKKLEKEGDFYRPVRTLTGGLVKSLSYYDPDVLVSFSGTLWELDPVEVTPRARPVFTPAPLPDVEESLFAQEGVDVSAFRDDLRQRSLALVVSRDVTSRDDADRQQPFNLRVAGGEAETRGDAGTVYQVSHLQFFQGDQVRGLGGLQDPYPGRRVLARPLHDSPSTASSLSIESAPPGSVELASDGSMAALVPAARALTWQLTDPQGDPVVRERYWLTFQAGEIRVCASCHGVNDVDQAGRASIENAPLALRRLLRDWKASRGEEEVFRDGFESGDLSAWSGVVGEGRIGVSGGAALDGNRGLSIDLEPQGRASLSYGSLGGRDIWNVRFLFDPNSATNRRLLRLGARNGQVTLLEIVSPSKERSSPSLRLHLQVGLKGFRLKAGAEKAATEWIQWSAGPVEIELDRRPIQGRVRLRLRVDEQNSSFLGSGPVGPSPSRLHLGVVQLTGDSWSGTIYLDRVEIRHF